MKQNTKISGAEKDGVTTRNNVSGSPMTVHRIGGQVGAVRDVVQPNQHRRLRGQG